MAYEYGSTDLGIRNPFKQVGAIQSIQGILVTVIGIHSLFVVKGLVATHHRMQGWLMLAAGLLLLVWGLVSIGIGLFRAMRFFVGRGVPASLAKNISKSEASVTEVETAYTSQQIEQMLQGRKNVTFIEPSDWFSRFIYTVFPKFILLPYTYRNMAQRVIKAVAQTLLGFLCFGLAWFSGSTGLIAIQHTPILNWAAMALALYLMVVWFSIRNPLQQRLQTKTDPTSIPKIVFSIVAAIFLPFGLLMLHTTLLKLPMIPLHTGRWIAVICVFATMATIVFFFLLFQRVGRLDPQTEVSELRDNWQESIHPQEIFIHFETIVMANRRYREVPNRVYREFDARLFEEGSDDKGHFSGEMIQETQPAFSPIPFTQAYKLTRTLMSLLGHSLLALSALWLYRAVGGFPLFSPGGGVGKEALLSSVETLFMGAIFYVFGEIMANFSLAFWAEMQFESLMIYFQCQGTYAASKLSTGASLLDSTRSENTVVRSSLTPWIIASRVVTSTFSKSGMKNLEHARHIIEMHKADTQLKMIADEIREFLRNRQSIAEIKSDEDLRSASRIDQLNKQSRMGYPGGQVPPIQIENIAPGALIDDHSGKNTRQ